MTCDCENKSKEQDGNGGNGNTCPPGQKMVDGKCIKETKEQIGDPKTQSTQGELPSGDPGDKQQVDPSSCGPGTHFDAAQQQCVPDDESDPGDGQTQGTDKTASIERLELEFRSLKNQLLGEQSSKKPTATVSNKGSGLTEYKSIEEIGNEYVEALRQYGKYEFNIPLEYYRSIRVGNAAPSTGVREAFRNTPLSIQEAYRAPNKVVKEVVAITNTHATQDLDTDVAIVPGGISFIPVFQFAKVKQIEQGFDRARFFKTTLPANGSQTVGTTPTEATQTITAIEVTPSTITGVYLIGDYDEIENSPFDLLQAIVEASSASYEDFVATDMLDTVSDEATLGAGTIGLWIRGDTGAVATTSDTASVAMDAQGLFVARQYLENQGYLRGGIKPVCVMHPQQWRELVLSDDITSLSTRSVPDIWMKANLEEIAGVQIVVSNAIEANAAQTNTGLNALMFIPKHSYGIAVKRDVTVKFHDYGEDNQVRVNTTWRTKSGVLDALSIVRLSTTSA